MKLVHSIIEKFFKNAFSMESPTDTQAKLLRQIFLSGMIDHVAKKLSAEEIKERGGKKQWNFAYK